MGVPSLIAGGEYIMGGLVNGEKEATRRNKVGNCAQGNKDWRTRE